VSPETGGKDHEFRGLVFEGNDFSAGIATYISTNLNGRTLPLNRPQDQHINVRALVNEIFQLAEQPTVLREVRQVCNVLRKMASTIFVARLAKGQITPFDYAASCVLLQHTTVTDVKDYCFVGSMESLYPEMSKSLDIAKRIFNSFVDRQNDIISVAASRKEEVQSAAQRALNDFWTFVTERAQSQVLSTAADEGAFELSQKSTNTD